MMSEARSVWPSVVDDGLVEKVNKKCCENRWLTIRMLCGGFPLISKTVLHDLVKRCGMLIQGIVLLHDSALTYCWCHSKTYSTI